MGPTNTIHCSTPAVAGSEGSNEAQERGEKPGAGNPGDKAPGSPLSTNATAAADKILQNQANTISEAYQQACV